MTEQYLGLISCNLIKMGLVSSFKFCRQGPFNLNSKSVFVIKITKCRQEKMFPTVSGVCRWIYYINIALLERLYRALFLIAVIIRPAIVTAA